MSENQDKIMTVDTPIIVRGYDVDFMGVVNNTVYVKWLEDMRMALLDKYFPLTQMLKDGNAPILAETSIQYKHPVTFNDHPVGHCRIHLIGRSRWQAEFEIEENGRVFATAQQTGYYFNIERHRPVPFPDQWLNQYLM